MKMHLLLKFFLLDLILLSQIRGQKACLEEERLGLLDLKSFANKFHSDHSDLIFPSWVDDPESDCCVWQRGTCNSTTGRVIQLSLYNETRYAMNYCPRPSFWNHDKSEPLLWNISLFQRFKELRTLDLSYNEIDGWMQNQGSEGFLRLELLETLDLTCNNLGNNTLQSLRKLTSLKNLILRSNLLEGSFPVEELSVLESLETLDLSQNFVNGFPRMLVMVRLYLRRDAERRKRLLAMFKFYMEICRAVSSFLTLLSAASTLCTYRPRVRSYALDFATNREYVRRLVYDNDISCISQIRMNRVTFLKLCEMLESIGGLKSTKNMLVDEQVAIFLHIIAHHVKNRVISLNFRRSGESISRHFHNVLAAVLKLQEHLFRKPEPIPTNSTDNRWKWFKNCLGALDGTYIRVKVPSADKPRYRTRKGNIATNMLGVCTPDMQFVFVLPGWEGSVADGRVLRDALRRRNGLKVPNENNVHIFSTSFSKFKGNQKKMESS
ncbi:PREDICTED: uncharacterized protein LOC18507245 isoform X2 [Theobroma cacao]|uniref:Uncharacterized protein LOC18507245 isoform X2 n=1 Tax=Theobroma cacao TaxID=3641 RepID=A0AB32WJJ2_THECC|nr:PREDICTED: uncharacterized protein LOC18507245 isoform X2 [Theobroma cacao]